MRVRYLMEFGLQGLEAYYSGFTPKLRRRRSCPLRSNTGCM